MDSIIEFLLQYGYWGMFLSAFLAGTILPFSSEAVMMSFIAGGLNPVNSVLVTAFGNTLGGLTCFYLGYLGNRNTVKKYLRMSEAQIQRAERFIGGRGAWIAFFSFIPLVGDAMLVALGLMRAHRGGVILSMTLGKVVRYTVMALVTLGVLTLW